MCFSLFRSENPKRDLKNKLLLEWRIFSKDQFKKAKFFNVLTSKPDDISEQNANSFQGGKFFLVEFKKPIQLYRYYDKEENKFGAFWSGRPYTEKEKIQARMELAILRNWNSLSNVLEIWYVGSAYVGLVGAQQESGHFALGGGVQIVLNENTVLNEKKDYLKRVKEQEEREWKAQEQEAKFSLEKALRFDADGKLYRIEREIAFNISASDQPGDAMGVAKRIIQDYKIHSKFESSFQTPSFQGDKLICPYCGKTLFTKRAQRKTQRSEDSWPPIRSC